jgi:hypothetical protein
MLKEGGVVIEDADGNRRAVSPKEASDYIAGLPEERKSLYKAGKKEVTS